MAVFEESRRYEMTIPILLLILVLLIVAWKMGWLEGILGPLFPGARGVLIIGNDPLIESKLAEITGINVHVLRTKEDIATIASVGYFDKYDMIIIVEDTGERNGELPALTRDLIGKALAKNKKLIFYGIAGSRDPASPAFNAWGDARWSAYMPVECQTTDPNRVCSNDAIITDKDLGDVSMKILDAGIGHPILTGYEATVQLTPIGVSPFMSITKANVKKGNTLAILEVTIGTEKPAYPAIVEHSVGFGGKVIYFAYHPAYTPDVFKRTIEYLR